MNRDQLVAGGVAVAAFACSAAHIYTVARGYGNPPVVAGLHPLGLDGLIFVGLRNIKRAPAAGWLAAGYGAVMSLVFNAASYADVKLWWPIMAAAMPLAMVLGFVVIHAGHKDKAAVVPPVVPTAPVRVSRPRAVRVPTDVPTDVPLSVDTPADVPLDVPAVTPVPRKEWDRVLARKLLAAGDLSHRDIAEQVGCSRKSIDRLAVAVIGE